MGQFQSTDDGVGNEGTRDHPEAGKVEIWRHLKSRKTPIMARKKSNYLFMT